MERGAISGFSPCPFYAPIFRFFASSVLLFVWFNDVDGRRFGGVSGVLFECSDFGFKFGGALP